MSLPRIIVIALALSGVVSAVDADRLFAREIKPLLAAKCFACHGQNPALLLGELNLTTREGLLRGGKSGRAALAPGDAAASPLYPAVTWANAKLQMPPKENDRLTPQQVDSLREWINSGAPWPDDSAIARNQSEPSASSKVQVETSGGLADDWTNRRYDPEDLWAFQPVASTKTPDSSADNPIDAFHRAKIGAAGFKPANRADQLTLLRRATYDLTGLPPSPSEAAPFLEDDSKSAWEALVDRLLASPAYGEQWGRHWLDVACYADTAGNSNDYERSNAWRYRD